MHTDKKMNVERKRAIIVYSFTSRSYHVHLMHSLVFGRLCTVGLLELFSCDWDLG